MELLPSSKAFLKYSIIVPVFRPEEAVLDRCLHSLLSFHRSDYEIILVETLYQGQSGLPKSFIGNPLIRFISTSERGISLARNMGLEAASGLYCFFVDSDDFVSPHLLDIADSAIAQNPKGDLYVFGSTGSDGFTSNSYSKEDVFQIDGNEEKLSYFSTSKIHSANFQEKSVWAKLFRTSIIQRNSLKFDTSLLVAEDQFFVLRYLLCSGSAVFATECLVYHYEISASSLTVALRANSPECYSNCVTAWNALIDANPQYLSLKNNRAFNITLVYLPRLLGNYLCAPANGLTQKEAFKLFATFVKQNRCLKTSHECRYSWSRGAKKKLQLFLLKTHQLRLYFHLFWKLYHH
jgi:glycosyltransferase involved in cell wall biosynthesis